MKKIVSFGDSFIFGSELTKNTDVSKAWPGLIAKSLNCEYYTQAIPGCGNDRIAEQIYSWFANNSAKDTLAVINWTWTHRWDFYIAKSETWVSVGRSCVPEELAKTVESSQAQEIIDFYNNWANQSLLWNKFRNLQTIYAVQSYLKERGVIAVQTYMDYHLFDQNYHAPDYITELQKLIKPQLELFENKNFLDWSYEKGFAVTEILHPLEEAHKAAVDVWQEKYYQLLFI